MDLLGEISEEERIEILRILAEYRSRQKYLKTENPEHDGWVLRIDDLDGVDGEHLSRIHGQLIAWGCLKFQIASRFSGVVYQISSEGENLLETRSNSQPGNACKPAA